MDDLLGRICSDAEKSRNHCRNPGKRDKKFPSPKGDQMPRAEKREGFPDKICANISGPDN